MTNSIKEGTFAYSLSNIYEPLNESENFKEKFKTESFKILLNPKDGDSAALISVNNGVLSVQSINNSDKKNIDQQTVGWDGMMETTIDLFKQIGDGSLTSKDITKKIVSRKIKIKNPKINRFNRNLT